MLCCQANQSILNGSWCWTDAVCYVGQRGGQGAHTELRCERGTLQAQQTPVDPVDDDHWDDGCCRALYVIILFLFYPHPLISYLSVLVSVAVSLFCFPLSFCLICCSTDMLLSMSKSNNSRHTSGLLTSKITALRRFKIQDFLLFILSFWRHDQADGPHTAQPFISQRVIAIEHR